MVQATSEVEKRKKKGNVGGNNLDVHNATVNERKSSQAKGNGIIRKTSFEMLFSCGVDRRFIKSYSILGRRILSMSGISVDKTHMAMK